MLAGLHLSKAMVFWWVKIWTDLEPRVPADKHTVYMGFQDGHFYIMLATAPSSP